jgi:hypothetical protein
MLFTFKCIKLLSCQFIFENNTVPKATFTGPFIKNASEESNFQNPQYGICQLFRLKDFSATEI